MKPRTFHTNRCILLSLTGMLFCLANPPARAGADTDETGLEIVGRYLEAARTQQATLRGGQMDADIDARLPKLNKQGHLSALRSISSIGQITYKPLRFSGDNTVKREVIARFLAAESQARDAGAIAITPANYKFRLKAVLETGSRRVYAFQLTPRKRRVGLFKGELWVDGQTGMPVRESGELVKSPSMFVKRVRFVRDFEIRGGVAIPSHMESTAATRLAGPAELDVRYSNFAVQKGIHQNVR